MEKEYIKRLVALGKETQDALAKSPDFAITENERIAMSKVNFLLGYIEALGDKEKNHA